LSGTVLFGVADRFCRNRFADPCRGGVRGMVDLGEATDRKQQRHLMKNRKLSVIYVENEALLHCRIAQAG
jgi:hypothetical protein